MATYSTMRVGNANWLAIQAIPCGRIGEVTQDRRRHAARLNASLGALELGPVLEVDEQPSAEDGAFDVNARPQSVEGQPVGHVDVDVADPAPGVAALVAPPVVGVDRHRCPSASAQRWDEVDHHALAALVDERRRSFRNSDLHPCPACRPLSIRCRRWHGRCGDTRIGTVRPGAVCLGCTVRQLPYWRAPLVGAAASNFQIG